MSFYPPFLCPRDKESGGIIYPCPSVRPFVRPFVHPFVRPIQIHRLSGYLLLQFWSYRFNILQDVYTHNGGVYVHRILIFIKYSQNDRQLDLIILFVLPDIDTWFVRLSLPTALIFCRMFIHIMEVCLSTGVHRILIFFKYSQNDRQLDLVIFFVLAA